MQLIYFLILCPLILNAQTKNIYEREEIVVINKFLDKIIDCDRYKKQIEDEHEFIVLLNQELQCDLEKESSYFDNYKTNTLLKRLENNKLGQRTIDFAQIKKIKGINIQFENYSKYRDDIISNNIIGFLTISRISFNEELTKGYFYYSIYCGEDCGWGDLIEITKLNGSWEITKYLSSWIS